MKSITCAILIDGLRYDYLNEEDTPFLFSMEKHGLSGNLRETFAFQLRPAFFAGLYPEDCNIAHLYLFDPENSPFKITKYIPELFLKVPRLRYFIKKFLIKYYRSIEHKRGNEASALYLDPGNIPYKLLRYFGPSEKHLIYKNNSLGNRITLFDIMREHQLDWQWIAYPTHKQTTDEILYEFRRILINNCSFYFLHFAELDWAGHKGGPNSYETRKALRGIDIAIKQIFTTLMEMHSNLKTLIFGDHGMVKIKKYINIQERLDELKSTVVKDYIYFLDSSQARFWFNNKEARNEITDMLEKIDGGRILTEKDYEKLKFRFNHNRFGDLIFAVDDNTLIFPNFFQNTNPVKGMHGYLPHIKGNWSKYIVCGLDQSFIIDKDPLELVEIFPLFLHLLELPVPISYEGVDPIIRKNETEYNNSDI